MLKAFFHLAPAVAVLLASAASHAGPEIQPGDALAQDELPPEAQRLEAAQQGRPLGAASNSVEERRRFDARWVELGLGTGLGMPATPFGGYAELTPLDRLSVGVEAGLTFWGRAGGGYVRLRPIIWGGQARRLMNAVVIQASYTLMRDGALDLVPCIDVCPALRYVDRTAQFGALSLGVEHKLASGWRFRYDFGVGHALFATAWKCVRFVRFADDVPAACEGQPPGDDLPILSFAVGHTL